MARELFYGISEQGKASKHRLVDAEILFQAGRWRGAMYMAGYAIECQLKTKLMRIFGCQELGTLEARLKRRKLMKESATVFTHQLELLLELTGGIDRLRQDAVRWRQFNIVNRWVPAWRYSADPSTAGDARHFLDAVKEFSRWIENSI